MCDKFFLGRHSTHILTQLGNPQQNLVQIPPKSSVVKMSYVRVTYRNIGEQLLIEAEITQKMVALSKPITACITKLGTWRLQTT